MKASLECRFADFLLAMRRFNLGKGRVRPPKAAAGRPLGIACAASLLTWFTGFASTVTFTLPQPTSFYLDVAALTANTPSTSAIRVDWISGRRGGINGPLVAFGDRVVLQLADPSTLRRVLGDRPLTLSRTAGPDLFILQAPDALIAIREAQALALEPGVLAAYPSFQESAALNGPYASFPTDKYYNVCFGTNFLQWHLESRDPATDQLAGYDLNVRSAWPFSRGNGVCIAVADLGVQVSHPDLHERTRGAPHHNFLNGSDNPEPYGNNAYCAHGTAVAGLAAATLNNGLGLAGVAPEAALASWVIFSTNGLLVSDERLMDMFQFASNTVGVQNHSWAKDTSCLISPSLLEQNGLDNAILFGRGQRGTIMIRSAGNRRVQGDNANDDGYASDPRVIAVAATRPDGRVASYSEPGACILVAAPSGDAGFPGLFTTDLTGPDGVNGINFLPPFEDLWDYAPGGLGFSGTSASTPQVAGIAALLLSANPTLCIRDVQQVMALSARHIDLHDPDLSTNGAGFRVSHNQGFGVPDAGQAVQLALAWSNRAPSTTVTLSNLARMRIPDDGLRLEVMGSGLPPGLNSVRAITSTGPHADDPMPYLPLADCGLCTNQPPADLTGKGALILRGMLPLHLKVLYAAQAGAAYAVVYNYPSGDPDTCPGGDQLCPIGGADFVPIPAVFIGNADGVRLRNLLALNPDTTARIHLETAAREFHVTASLLLEHVGTRVKTDHPLRGDLRITLVSPSGTRSVLQRYNADTDPGPVDWIYWSTHHFFESSAGRWRVEFTDESAGETGSVEEVDLILRGVAIEDTDADGLDDGWERAKFGYLGQGPRDDPDDDGSSNAREQLAGTDPLASDVAFELDLSAQREGRYRLSWPSVETRNYEIWAGASVVSLFLIANVPGRFPETEWTVSMYNAPTRFFQVRAVPW